MCLAMPKVSVIIPFYNVEKYLRECLDSILSQTFKDFEVICVDDGSKDASVDILREYIDNDDRFILLKQANQGAAAARNYGMSIAKGNYLLFLDSDDVFSEMLLEKSVTKAEVFNTDIVIFRAKSFDSVTGKQAALNDNIANFLEFESKLFSVNDVPDKIFNSFLIPAWNKLFKKEFILDNKIEFQNIKRSNDLSFTNKALVLAKRIVLLKEYLVLYRTGTQSNLQANNDKSPLAFYDALFEFKYFLDSVGLYTKVQKSFLNLAIEVIFFNLNSVKTIEARNLIIEKLKIEGFEYLGISNYINLRELSFWGWLQYKAVMLNVNKPIYKSLYGCFKLVQYFRLTGCKNTFKKVLLNINH